MKRSIILFLLILVGIIGFSEEGANAENIRNVILVSWDGVQMGHLLDLMEAGNLPNLKQLINEGKYTKIDIPPFIKVEENGEQVIVGLKNLFQIKREDVIYYECAVTDSGHARMLTGKWNCETGVFEEWGRNLLGIDFICGNNFKTVKDGLTIMEIIRAKKPEIYVGVTSSRRSDNREIREQYEELTGIFKGWGDDEIYVSVKSEDFKAVGDHGFYSTTFKYAEEDLDYFFDSQKIPQRLLGFYKDKCHIPVYDETTQKIIGLGELKDAFVAQKAISFIKKIATQNQFFLFTHFCEPDLFGHFYGENSDGYSKAIVSNDAALGIIINGLKNLGIYDETLIIVTTDHGATEDASGATFIYKEEKKWLDQLGPLHGDLDTNNHLIWMANNKFNSLPYNVVYQTDIVPFILNVLGIE